MDKILFRIIKNFSGEEYHFVYKITQAELTFRWHTSAESHSWHTGVTGVFITLKTKMHAPMKLLVIITKELLDIL